MLQERKAEGKLAVHKNIRGLSPSVAREWDKELEHWQELPPGTLLVVDEAQDFAKTNGKAGSPQWVMELSKHRHAGIDFVFISQDPRFLDPWVRRLANRHLHLVRKFGAEVSVTHEWDRCHDDPTEYHSTQASSKGLFRFPKELYQVYDSATLHQVQRKVPKKLYVLAALIPFGAFLLWWGVHHFTSKSKPVEAVAKPETVRVEGRPDTPRAGHALSGEEYVRQFAPVVSVLPWSAPAFQKMQPSDYPVAYCMAFETTQAKQDCRCLTQQGTRYEMALPLCLEVAKHGVFDPFHSQRRDLKEAEQKERQISQRRELSGETRTAENAQHSASASFGDHVGHVGQSFRAGPTENASGRIPSNIGQDSEQRSRLQGSFPAR